MIQLDAKEAGEIIQEAVKDDPSAAAITPSMTLLAMAGCIGIVNAMQRLGYRISRPLKEVSNG